MICDGATVLLMIVGITRRVVRRNDDQGDDTFD